jgi:hypothetical protein
MILLISASQVARLIGISHWHRAPISFLMVSFKEQKFSYFDEI